jgi:hypothetical protein
MAEKARVKWFSDRLKPFFDDFLFLLLERVILRRASVLILWTDRLETILSNAENIYSFLTKFSIDMN